MGKKWTRLQRKNYNLAIVRRRSGKDSRTSGKSSRAFTGSPAPSGTKVQEGELVDVLRNARGPSVAERLTRITRMLVDAQLQLVDLRDIIGSKDE